MNQQCKVCEEPAAGFHFGAFTCEGCKSFFGRAHTNLAAAAAAQCKTGDGRCVIDKQNRTSCRACRLKKCLAAGMSKSCSRYGRRSNWFKVHCLLQQQRLYRGGDDCVRPSPPPPIFGFAPAGWAPLPRSERSAFRETAVAVLDARHHERGNPPSRANDRPIDLTVRRLISDDNDDDDDDNNNNNGKYMARMTYGDCCATTPLDLTVANKNFGVRS